MKGKVGPKPFEGFLVYGPIMHKKEGRRMVVLVSRSDWKVRTTMSYARYLMCVSLGTLLPREIHVDHKDDNKLNDVLENLQLLSEEENKRKSAPKVTFVILACDFCGLRVIRRKGSDPPAKGYKLVFCNRECLYAFLREDKGR